ncbi:MAG: hypothetical protein R3B84_12320 [Zavarzinella sp.]
MWYRIFGLSEIEPDPTEMLHHLHQNHLLVEGHFKGDDLGWTQVSLQLGHGTPLTVDRFLTTQDDLRQDLNSWAAWLETLDYSHNSLPLMERLIQTQQLITARFPIDYPDEIQMTRLCHLLSMWLAEQTNGVLYIEGDGWYNQNNELLIKEY